VTANILYQMLDSNTMVKIRHVMESEFEFESDWLRRFPWYPKSGGFTDGFRL